MSSIGMLLSLGLAAALAAYGVTWVVLQRAHGKLMDIPNERSSHSTPIPRGGGIALVLLTCVGASLYSAQTTQGPTLWAFILGVLIIAPISFVDDVRSVPSVFRFIAHAAAALVAIGFLGAWRSLALPGGGVLDLGWFGPALTFLWIVGLINAYNFMDGIDGLAGTQAVVAGLVWAVVGALVDQPAVSVLGILIVGASLGFLGFNWPPARIFMGDVGSTFLGYALAVLPLMAAPDDPRTPLVAVLAVGPFVFDAAFTFFRRLVKKENVFKAHRSHLYQRLSALGHGHASVTSLYLVLAGIFGISALLSWTLPALTGVLSVLTLLIAGGGLWYRVIREEQLRRRLELPDSR